MLVARFTPNPESDIQRGWSAYFGERCSTYEMAAAVWLDLLTGGDVDPDDPNLDEMIEENDLDIRFDPVTQEWCRVHHDGLSCWALDSDSPENAIKEAKGLAEANAIEWGGFGSATQGKVRLICPVTGIENLYIFECEDVIGED